jgi:hypothetical protein
VTAPQPIVIEAAAGEPDRPALLAGAQQLAESLAAATGTDWPIQLRFWDPDGAITALGSGSVVVLSLIQEVDRDEPFSATEARLRVHLADLVGGGAPVLVCTVFRQVAERRTLEGSRRLERIRQLNRMTAELSHDLGVTVVDIDRAFAHIGGRVLATDYRLGGRLAAEVAGHTLVWSLLSLGLDDVISPQVQERAMTFHGGLREINRLVSRRLAAG